MKITLLVIGKTEESWLREGIEEYAGRLKRYAVFAIREIPAIRDAKSVPVADQKKKEAALLQKHIGENDLVVLLDEHGKETGSVQFAAFLNRQFTTGGGKSLVFVVGGPYGFDESLKSRAGHVLSLSRMTFSHQMVRLIFIEQLYRAMTILRNESYHHE
jgi:23S rRNA (pseudouridine1915-N3)-methyltransferase